VSRAGLVEAVRAATNLSCAPGLVGSDRLTGAVVRLFGSTSGVVYGSEDGEVARRAKEQPESVTRLDVLKVLMGLPLGESVPEENLSRADRALLRRAPQGAVERDGVWVVRRAMAPISVRLAVVASRDWRVGLKAAGQFAPYCARSVLLPSRPEDWEQVSMRAAFFGVGVMVPSAGTITTLVEPEPYVRRRHTPAHWWFAEEIWRQLKEFGSIGGEAASTAESDALAE
jgi:hypothetical protein